MSRQAYCETLQIFSSSHPNFSFHEPKESHLEEILSLENAHQSIPWSRQLFLEELRNTISLSFILQDEFGKVQGYLFSRIICDELEILNIVVSKSMHRRGLGKALLCKVLAQAETGGAKNAFLEVRSSNEAAISLYENIGFVFYGLRKKYYSDNQEDAQLYRLEF